MKKLDGKIIVIAGGSGGIGSAVYKKLLTLNSTVIGISRSENIHLKNFAKQNNLEYNWIMCDITSASGWKDSLNKIIQSIFRPKPEIVLPVGTKTAAFLLNQFPHLFELIFPVLNSIGRRNRNNFSPLPNAFNNEGMYEN